MTFEVNAGDTVGVVGSAGGHFTLASSLLLRFLAYGLGFETWT